MHNRYVKTLGPEVGCEPPGRTGRSVAAAAQGYYYRDNRDLYHFIKLVTAAVKDPAAAAKGGSLMGFISDKMILFNGYTKPTSADSHGLAVYLPSPAGYDPDYGTLLWAKDSKWDELVRWYAGN